MRHVTWILRLYPGAWRNRYEEEMVALLEQHTITLATCFDLLLGALDARLDPSYRTTKALFLFKDERMIATTFLCAFAIFLLTVYNWHHYIPLALSLSPFYMNLGMLSTHAAMSPGLFASPAGLTSDSLLATSDLVMQATLLAINLFFIALLAKQAKKTGLRRFILSAALCLFLFFALPLIPLLRISTPVASFDNQSWTIWSVQVSSFDHVRMLYMWSFRLLWPHLALLLSSLFIAMIRLKDVMNITRKQWLFLAAAFYLILPVSRMLWLYDSVQIPSSILPTSSLALGAVLTYFPSFAALGAMILAVASNEGSKRIWRVALVPATILSLAMLVKLAATIVTLSLTWSSMQLLTLPWNAGPSMLTLATMVPVMFIAGGITLVTLMRGFIALKTPELHAQNDATALG